MPTIIYKHRANGTLTTLGSLPTATVTRKDTEQVAIVATDMVLGTVGVYSYDFEDPEYDLEYTILIKDGATELKTMEVFGESDLYYGNITEGNTYFDSNIFADGWDGAENAHKLWAMEKATKTIDALALVGTKLESEQTKQFPRSGQDEIPVEIAEAMFEIALKLLDGYEPDEEANLLSVSGRTYAGARTTFDTQSAGKPWIATGILSHTAWRKLIPYMHNSRALRMIRA